MNKFDKLPSDIIKNITSFFYPIHYKKSTVVITSATKIEKYYNPVFLVNEAFYFSMPLKCIYCYKGVYIKKLKSEQKCNTCGHLISMDKKKHLFKRIIEISNDGGNLSILQRRFLTHLL